MDISIILIPTVLGFNVKDAHDELDTLSRDRSLWVRSRSQINCKRHSENKRIRSC
jgi:hypothetical protein